MIEDLLHFFPLNSNHYPTVLATFSPCDSWDISETISLFIIYFLFRKTTYCLHHPFDPCLSSTNLRDISKDDSMGSNDLFDIRGKADDGI